MRSPNERDLLLGKTLKHEAVHHPQHYGGDTDYETIKVMIAWDPEMAYHFCVGNAIKYLSRIGKKDPEKRAEDLRKSAWYSGKAAEIYEAYLSEAAEDTAPEITTMRLGIRPLGIRQDGVNDV
jgi:hypothetical protein